MAYSSKPSAPSMRELSSSMQGQNLGSSDLTLLECPSSQVEITISAKDLLNRDSMSYSDPVCILYMRNSTTILDWIEINRTECVKNNLNPAWAKKFVVEYKFEERQLCLFKIYDFDGKSLSLSTHDFLGKMECALGEIVSSPSGKLTRELQLPELYKEQKRSSITIVAEELNECKKFISMKIDCKFPSSKFSFGTSACPCLTISKQLDDKSWILLHRNDRFDKAFSLRIASITSGGNLERPLKWQFFSKKQNSKWLGAKVIGEFTTNYLQLIEKYRSQNKSFQLINRSGGGDVGSVSIATLCIEDQPTFLDHLQNGLVLKISVAIDFTASNGEPTRHTSLHYKHGQIDNPYVLAIKTAGEIIQDYSVDKRMAAFGFGAKGYPKGNSVSHNFPINLKPSNPYCDGIEGILQAYYRVIKRIKLFGPTVFTPVIQEQAKLAKASQNEHVYHVLLIITDGIICDPVTTRDTIVKSSSLPMSLIIIGVGDEDFKEMDKLDSDGSFLKDSKGNLACRDIVQFVELKKFVDFRSINPMDSTAKSALTQAVLAELPDQVNEYMRLFSN